MLTNIDKLRLVSKKETFETDLGGEISRKF